MIRKFVVLTFLVALVAVGGLVAQGQSAPTLRIVTEDPNLPSDLFYGNLRVKPLRLRPGTNTPITIDDSDFFVQNHYIDFLNRFPETDGFNYWMNILNGCGTDRNCLNRTRVEISSRFFIELEFQQTGYFVMRTWKAALGRFPNYAEFVADRRQVQNNDASRRAFADSFVARSSFRAIFDGLSNQQYVDRLYDTANLRPYTSERAAHTAALGGGTKTRADVLREVIEIGEFRTREFNLAFVRMQYFGYLRRDAEPEGEAFWIDVVNNRSPNNYQGMICSFVNSSEYQLRFGAQRGRFTELDCTY